MSQEKKNADKGISGVVDISSDSAPDFADSPNPSYVPSSHPRIGGFLAPPPEIASTYDPPDLNNDDDISVIEYIVIGSDPHDII